MATRTGNAPARNASRGPARRLTQGNSPTPDSKNDNHGGIAGLVLGGALPPVSGRGRKADPVPDSVRVLWEATLAGKGVADQVYSQKEFSLLKRQHEKLEKELADSDGNQTVDTAYRTVEGTVATGANDAKATAEIRVIWAAHYLNAAAEVR